MLHLLLLSDWNVATTCKRRSYHYIWFFICCATMEKVKNITLVVAERNYMVFISNDWKLFIVNHVNKVLVHS